MKKTNSKTATACLLAIVYGGVALYTLAAIGFLIWCHAFRA